MASSDWEEIPPVKKPVAQAPPSSDWEEIPSETKPSLASRVITPQGTVPQRPGDNSWNKFADTTNKTAQGIGSGGVGEIAAPLGGLIKSAGGGLSNLFKSPAARADLVDMFKAGGNKVASFVSDKLGQAEEAFNAKNINLPYATQQAAGKGRMVAVNLENLKGVSPEMDAHVERLRAQTSGESAPQTPTPQTPTPANPETNLKPYATDRSASSPFSGGDDMNQSWTNMEGGSQKYATPQINSKFGNSLDQPLKQAIENPSVTPQAPKQPIRVQADPEAYAADFPANHVDPSNPLSSNKYDPRALYGTKPGETLIPAEDAFQLRKMANKQSRFTSQQMYSDPTAQAKNLQAKAAGDHIRGALSDLDPALGDISDKLEDAYALRENALGTAGKKPISTITGTNMDKSQTLGAFDEAAGTNIRQLGKDVDQANIRTGGSRSAQAFGQTDLTTPRGLLSTAVDAVPRAYDALGQFLNPATKAAGNALQTPAGSIASHAALQSLIQRKKEE